MRRQGAATAALGGALLGLAACSLNTGASPHAQARDPYFLYLPYAQCGAPDSGAALDAGRDGAPDAGRDGAPDAGPVADRDAGAADADAGPRDGALTCRNLHDAAAPRVPLEALPPCGAMCEALSEDETWAAGGTARLARCATTRRAARAGGGVEIWAYCEYPVIVATYWRERDLDGLVTPPADATE